MYEDTSSIVVVLEHGDANGGIRAQWWEWWRGDSTIEAAWKTGKRTIDWYIDLLIFVKDENKI